MNTIAISTPSVQTVRTALKYTYAIVPIVAGADKFLNLLTNWPAYLQPLDNMLPVAPATFMKIVGVIEIVAGLLVLRLPRLGALVVTAWLVAIAIVLIAGGFYDIAVRDLVMAVGAFCLSKLYQSPAAFTNSSTIS